MVASDEGQHGARHDDVVRIVARAHEPDRYLAALLAPRAARADLVALAAVVGEIGRIPGYVGEPMAGEIRLQWWRDAIGGPMQVGEATGNPVADALGNALRRQRLPVAPLLAFIDAHAEQLYDTPIADEPALAAHLAATHGSAFELAWRLLAGAGEAPAPELIASAAQAYGLARLLVEFPARLAQGRTLMPASLLARVGLTVEALRRGPGAHAIRSLLDETSSRARRSARAVRDAWRTAPHPLRTALLPVALVGPYLRSLDVSSEALMRVVEVSPLERTWRIWCAHRLGLFW